MLYSVLTRQPSSVACLYKQSATPTIETESGIDLLILSLSVEYHATVDSCSDKFHVDIPNVS
jgi:hypothetical protein